MDQESINRYVLDKLRAIDESGIAAISKIVCGDGQGLKYRRKIEILDLLRQIGADAELDEEGKKESRQVWTSNRLRELQAYPDVFLELLKHLIDPRAFRFNHQILARTIEQLNSVLGVDGIGFEIADSRVQVQPVELSIPLWPESKVNFEALSAKGILLNEKLEQVVGYRLLEAAKCRESQAYLASIVMLTSAIEALLIGFFVEHLSDRHEPSSVPRYRNGQSKPPQEWKLFDMINVAHEMNWIQTHSRDFGQVVRDYRNLVHGYMQYQKNYSVPDAGTCSICWSVSAAVLADLRFTILKLKIDG